MDEHEATQQRSASARAELAILGLAYTRLKNIVRPQRHAEQPVAGLFLRPHLPAAVTDENHVAILFEQTANALIVAFISINKADDPFLINSLQYQHANIRDFARD